jgi:hypothetical protein
VLVAGATGWQASRRSGRYHAAVDHMVPAEGQWRDDDGSGYGYFFVRGGPEEAAALAEMRERHGDEVVDDLLRSRERRRHPRPLTETERAVIRQATAPVLRDLDVSGAIVPEILYQSPDDDGRDGRDGVSTDITLDGGHRGSVWTPTEQCSSGEQVWWAAHELQEWEVHELWEAGRSTSWPECPEHPNSHPLEPNTDDEDTAVWRCPRTRQVICAIGALGSPPVSNV